MRVLLVPWYWSKGDARRGANFNALFEYTKWGLKNIPDLWIELVVPSEVQGTYTHVALDWFSELEGSDRLRLWRVPTGRLTPRVDGWGWPQDWLRHLSPYSGRVNTDAIYVGNPFAVSQLMKAATEAYPSIWWEIPIVANIEDPLCRPLRPHANFGGDRDLYQQMQMFGMNVANRTIFHQGWNRKLMLREMRRWFAMSAVRRLLERTPVVPYPVDTEWLDTLGLIKRRCERQKVDPGLVVLFGGRFMAKKGFRQILDMVTDVGVIAPVRFAVITPDDEPPEEFERYVVLKGANREAFIKNLWRGDIQLVVGDYEDTGTGYWEMAYGGLVTIFLNREWHRYLWEPINYPYVAGSLGEMRLMLLHIVRRFAETQHHVDALRQRINDVLGTEVAARKFWGVMQDAAREGREACWKQYGTGTWGKLLERALSVADWPDVLTFDSVYDLMQEASESGVDLKSATHLCSPRIVRQLMLQWYSDTCRGAEMVFVKHA